jgi:hypothetical protein
MSIRIFTTGEAGVVTPDVSFGFVGLKCVQSGVGGDALCG